MIGPMHSVPEIKRTVDWGYYSTPQKHLLDRKMPAPRGKVVGGSSSINGMVYVRGNRANYDSWAAEGNTGWDADSVNAAYQRMEDFEDGENEYRGAGGPIRITRNRFPQEGTLQFIQATSDALGRAGPRRLQRGLPGGHLPDAAERRGRPALQRLPRLRAQPRPVPTLELQTEVLVRKVVIENGRATGVEVDDKDGTRRTVRAGKEVILSAGFVGSAQLLMLSGVGHAQHLRDHGIEVVADLPVGDNLHDHLFHAMTFHATSAKMKGNAMFFARGLAKELLRPGTTFLANSVFESVGFVRTSHGHRRPGPAAAPAAVGLRLAQPGRPDPARRRPAHRADRPGDADLPEEPGHPAAGLGRPDRCAADRLQLPRRPGRPRRARGGLRDGPRDHGRQGLRRRDQGGDPPRRPAAGQ